MSNENGAVVPGSGVMCALHDEAVKEIRGNLRQILDQTTATNGRIRSLEAWRIGLTATMAGILAGMIGGSELVAKFVGVIAGGGK